MTETVFLMVLASAVIHAAWNIAAKRTSGNAAVFWLAQLLAIALVSPFVVARWPGFVPSPQTIGYLALTGLAQALYFVLLSRAYKVGDISVVYPIARGLSVACTTLSAALFLQETLSPLGVTGVVTICSGTMLLGARKLEVRELKPLLYAAAIGVVLAFGGTVDKLAVGQIDPVIYIFFMFSCAALLAAPIMLTSKRDDVRVAWTRHRRSIAVVGVGSMGGYLIALFAFRDGSLAYVTAIRESSCLLGALWGYLVMKETFTLRRGAGMVLILAGLGLIRLA